MYWPPGAAVLRRPIPPARPPMAHSSTLEAARRPRTGQTALYRILVTDDIDREGIDVLTAEPQLDVHEVPTLPAAELLERIGEYDAIIGRSATRIS